MKGRGILLSLMFGNPELNINTRITFISTYPLKLRSYREFLRKRLAKVIVVLHIYCTILFIRCKPKFKLDAYQNVSTTCIYCFSFVDNTALYML